MDETCDTCAYIDIDGDSPYCIKLKQIISLDFSCEYHTFKQVFDETAQIKPVEKPTNEID